MDELSLKVPSSIKCRVPSPEWGPVGSPCTPPTRSGSCPEGFSVFSRVADEGLANHLHIDGAYEYVRAVDRLYEAVQRWVDIQPDPFGSEEDNRFCCTSNVSLVNANNRLVLKNSKSMRKESIQEGLVNRIFHEMHSGWTGSVERKNRHEDYRIALKPSIPSRSYSGISLNSIMEDSSE